jgi:hypothetical protein
MYRHSESIRVSTKLVSVLAAGAIFVFTQVVSASVVYQVVNQTNPLLNIGGDEVSITSTFNAVAISNGTDYESRVYLNLSPNSLGESNQFDKFAQFGIPDGTDPSPLSFHEIGPSDTFGSGTANIGLLLGFDNVFANGGGGGSYYSGNFPPPPFGDDQIGLTLTLSDGLTHYAWIDYSTTSIISGQNDGVNFYGYVTGFAYENQPNTPILSGQIPVPEPTTAGIAINAVSMAVFRRRFRTQ